ncbi:MAG: SixA phosphatase family protein [Janthinobacterium lividum]
MVTDPLEASSPLRRLVLLRHAKSSWKDDLPDARRPLSDRGRRDALEAGHWLAEHVGRADLVLCSTAVRTRSTWARVCEAEPDLLGTVPVRYESAVYEAWSDTLLDLLHELPADVTTVVLVGHGPGLPDLAERLDRVSGDGPLGKYKTSGIAVFAVFGSWAELGPGTAALTAFVAPRG